MNNLLAQNTNPFGTVDTPAALKKYSGSPDAAIGQILNVVLKTLVVGAAIYALINFILAGYAFLSAGGDSKKVADAWAKIYQTAIGLAFAAGAFVLAAIFGQLIFGDPTFLLQPRIPGI